VWAPSWPASLGSRDDPHPAASPRGQGNVSQARCWNLDLRCSLWVPRTLHECMDQSRGSQGLAEPALEIADAVEPVDVRHDKISEASRELLGQVGICRGKLVRASPRSSLRTCLAEHGLVASRLESPAQLEQILLAMPALLPLRSLLAAEGSFRGTPSFDSLHRVSTKIASPRRTARLDSTTHPHSLHGWLRVIMQCAPADEANC